eukprot:Em0028g14a
MGVPAFFRWLSRKYPSVVVPCTEEKAKVMGRITVPVDATQPNPNGVEFDNLYLDMNGIIHPCCHPEDKAAPKDEDEMMVAIFEYIDRIFNIVRPRRLLYMAIDGVAPRAKMNQQRSRRFRSAKESSDKLEEIKRIRQELKDKGCEVPPMKEDHAHFDSNCITPGTSFMDNLSVCLQYYIHDRLNNNPAWQGIKVILSDANVPADLIMLGLATHEPYFTILREEFNPNQNQQKPCEICNQIGHSMKDCTGMARVKAGEFDEMATASYMMEKQFIFLRLTVLREYLERELKTNGLPFPFDLEDEYSAPRFIPEGQFAPTPLGNSSTPVRNARLEAAHMRQASMSATSANYSEAARLKGLLKQSGEEGQSEVGAGEEGQSEVGAGEEGQSAVGAREEGQSEESFVSTQSNNTSFVAASPTGSLPASLRPSPSFLGRYSVGSVQKRKSEEQHGEEDGEEEEEPVDTVRLWEDGWKERYYQDKYGLSSDDGEFVQKVAEAYTRGLCWVFGYYYQGCPSWKWFYPFHYAPFASDFKNISHLNNWFDKGTQPFKPLEQLMGVFPAASAAFLPATWQQLMVDEDSSIIDFYPTNFRVDLNGKKFAWQGVALLPFVDEERLLRALQEVYDDLMPDETAHVMTGFTHVMAGCAHVMAGCAHVMADYPCQGWLSVGMVVYVCSVYAEFHAWMCQWHVSRYPFLIPVLFLSGPPQKVQLNPEWSGGVRGTVWAEERMRHIIESGGVVESPLPCLPNIPRTYAIR